MSANPNSNYAVHSPHAAIKIWNYSSRGGAEGMDPNALNNVAEIIVSTVSCISISTRKSKGNPIGSFSFELAPTRNWVSEIVAGSWCVIMMSSEPIEKSTLEMADARHVKMFGKIESVTASVSVNSSGARTTVYRVEGMDWGYIFSNMIYMDPLIPSSTEPQNWGNTFALFLIRLAESTNGAPYQVEVNDLILFFINMFAANNKAIQDKEGEIHRLGKSIQQFLIPKEVVDFFSFVYPNNKTSKDIPRDYVSAVDPNSAPPKNEKNIQEQEPTQDIAKLITLRSGKLIGHNAYQETRESYTYFNPFMLNGTNTFWQVMSSAVNNALCELVTDMEWTSSGRPRLTLYNRIRPFSYRAGLDVDAKGEPIESYTKELRSMFYYIKTFDIENVSVVAVNVGTNWSDKYNFVEVRPDFPEFRAVDGITAQKSQSWDADAFSREGFRPLIIQTRQFPRRAQDDPVFAPDKVKSWVQLNMEWYFDTHRLLSGAIKMTGTSYYISVGSNIKFDYGLVNTQRNFSSGTIKNKSKLYVLAHVESVNHEFEVEAENGARSFFTTVQFVRGIIVNENNNVVNPGSLDENVNSIGPLSVYGNHLNVVTASDIMDPDNTPNPVHTVIKPPGRSD